MGLAVEQRRGEKRGVKLKENEDPAAIVEAMPRVQSKLSRVLHVLRRADLAI